MKTNSQFSDAGNKFNFYLGIVLEDKSPNAEDILVHIAELTPFIDGKVETQSNFVKVGDESSNSYSNVEISNGISATYFSFITNRAYAPDVKKNEQVLVFRYGDAHKYYWVPLGRDDHLRRTERYTIRVSDNLTVPQGLSDNNCYTLELDTKYKGHILLKTAKTTEEAFQYQIRIDTINSTIQICDDNDNQIFLDSNVPRIKINNTNGSYVDVVKDNVNVVAPQDIILKADRQILIDTPNITVANQAGDGSCVMNSKNMAINSSGSMVIKAPSIGLDGSVVTDTILANHVQASGYSTGGGVASASIVSSYDLRRASKTPQYTPTKIDLYSGQGSDPNNQPRSGDDSSNRYCAAWGYESEDSYGISGAIEQICLALDALSGIDHNPNVTGYTANARTYTANAKMELNRGE
jgi:hypothetical protein